MQNQHTRELISAQKRSHKHNSKDQSCLQTLTWHSSKYKVHKLHQRYVLFGWSLSTLHLLTSQLSATVGDSGLCSCVCVATGSVDINRQILLYLGDWRWTGLAAAWFPCCPPWNWRLSPSPSASCAASHLWQQQQQKHPHLLVHPLNLKATIHNDKIYVIKYLTRTQKTERERLIFLYGWL